MKPNQVDPVAYVHFFSFSALGRAVWDETFTGWSFSSNSRTFSALGRAVWDETPRPRHRIPGPWQLSVLSVEPYGMKPIDGVDALYPFPLSVLSVEPYGMKLDYIRPYVHRNPDFQCSRSSRMG